MQNKPAQLAGAAALNRLDIQREFECFRKYVQGQKHSTVHIMTLTK